MASKEKNALSQVERQLLLYELFIFNREFVSKELIKHCLPISDRMMQRDIQHLMEAGLIRVKYSRAEKAYVQYPEEAVFNPNGATGRWLLHLERLNRIGTLMRELDNDNINEDEIFDRTKLKSIKQSYEELYPGIPDRTRQRDFIVLRNIGYPIQYIRQYRYYNAWNWDFVQFRDYFGVYLENGVLKRKRGETDHMDQKITAADIARNDKFLKEMESEQ